MKQTITLLMLFLASLLQAAGLHYSKVSGPVKNVGNIEIVVEKPYKVLNFTANEVKKFLKLATGKEFPIVKKPTGKAFAIILGDNTYSRAAGIDVKKLPNEGYVMLRQGNKLFIAGLDDLNANPNANAWNQAYNRNTLNAVYDFFERFADAGFFFPGPHGTVVPFKNGLFLPEKLEVREVPDMKMRSFYLGRNKWHEKSSYNGGVRGHNMMCLYHRLSNSYYPFGHGMASLKFVQRFGKTHPEYFAKMADGKRFCDPKMSFTGQLCWSSGIKDEVIKDVKAFFRKQPASSRGMKVWDTNGRYGQYFSIMAQDWFYWCGCDVCKKIAQPGRDLIYKDRKHNQAVSDYIWQFTADVANAIKKENIPGYITQMAYRPYDLIPKCEIPDNVKVMVAVNTAGGDTPKAATDSKLIKTWATKLKQPVMLWTYSCGKFGSKGIPAVPPFNAVAMSDFLDVNRGLVDGIFWEAETEASFLQFYNIFVLSRKMWNTSLKTSDIIDRHHRILFGKGAPMMKKFYADLEYNWFRKIISNTVDTGLGPKTQVPRDFEIWTKIYSPAKMRQYDALFNAALKAAAADKKTVERIKYVRTHLLDPLKKQCEKFHSLQNAVDSWKVYIPGTVHLRSYAGEINDVSTQVKVSADTNNLIFRFDCEEPRMKDIKAAHTGRDGQIFADSSVEILLNPSGDRKNYFQFIINSNGAIADYKITKPKKLPTDIKWNSSATAKAEKRADGWSVTVTIPKKDLGKMAENMPVNFARHRALNGTKIKEIYYQWSPVSGNRAGFHEIERWGFLSRTKDPVKPLLHADFSSSTKLPYWWGTRKKQQVVKFDEKVFVSGGRSVYMKNVKDGKMGMVFKIPALKPSKKYRLSYFLKTRNIDGPRGAGAFIGFNKTGKYIELPSPNIIGTNSWHRQYFEFKTPADTGEGHPCKSISFWIWSSQGEAWFDEIRLEEVK